MAWERSLESWKWLISKLRCNRREEARSRLGAERMSGSPSPAPDAGAPSTDETAGQIAEQIYTSTSQVVFVIALASACIGILIAFRVRHVRYWRMRAYSAKVLDEIEMEFVNDDADMFVLEDDELPRGSRCQPFFMTRPPVRICAVSC